MTDSMDITINFTRLLHHHDFFFGASSTFVAASPVLRALSSTPTLASKSAISADSRHVLVLSLFPPTLVLGSC